MKPTRDDAKSHAPAVAARRRTTTWTFGGVAVVVLAILVIVAMLNSWSNKRAEGPRRPSAGSLSGRVATDSDLAADSAGRRAAPTNVDSAGAFIVEDDGQLLWASPTSGRPIQLDYVPQGARLLLHLRPAEVVAHAEGAKALAALGPWGQRMVNRLHELMGAELQEIDALLVAIFTDANDDLQFAVRADLIAPWDGATMRERFKDSSTRQRDGLTLFEKDDVVRFLPRDRDGRTIIACRADAADGLVNSNGAPQPLPRDLSAILSTTDAQRTVTVAWDPRFLKASGTKLATGSARAIADAADALLGSEASAASLSADWSDHFFLELRVVPNVTLPPHRLARQMHVRFDETPATIESVVRKLNEEAYGRRLLMRLPDMIGQANALLRSGTDADQSVLNWALPSNAGASLIAAAELLIVQPGDNGAPAHASTPPTSSAGELLAKRTSFRVEGESLEAALETLAGDIGIPIEIRGRDLQLEGITRNQTLSLNQSNQPAADILTAVLRQANPDRSAAGPTDSRQKLVYVVAETDAAGGPPVRIIVTTRAAAARRGDKLPQVFVQPGP